MRFGARGVTIEQIMIAKCDMLRLQCVELDSSLQIWYSFDSHILTMVDIYVKQTSPLKLQHKRTGITHIHIRMVMQIKGLIQLSMSERQADANRVSNLPLSS